MQICGWGVPLRISHLKFWFPILSKLWPQVELCLFTPCEATSGTLISPGCSTAEGRPAWQPGPSAAWPTCVWSAHMQASYLALNVSCKDPSRLSISQIAECAFNLRTSTTGTLILWRNWTHLRCRFPWVFGRSVLEHTANPVLGSSNCLCRWLPGPLSC